MMPAMRMSGQLRQGRLCWYIQLNISSICPVFAGGV